MASKKKESKAENKKSEADLIWNQLKDITVNLFGLNDQRLHMYATRLPIAEDKLYLKPKASALIPILEEQFRTLEVGDYKFSLEQQSEYLIISRHKRG